MKWFRFYHEFVDDPKIAMMSDSDQLLWVKALCLASDSKVRGIIMLSDEEICWKLRVTMEIWKHAIDKFRAKGMLDHHPDGYKITHWDERQFESDSSAERTRAYRAKLAKQAKGKSDASVTSQKSHCNDSVTPSDPDPYSDPEQNIKEKNTCAPTKKTTKKKSTGVAVQYSDEFEALWAAYPRKVNKKAAFETYEAKLGYSDPEDIHQRLLHDLPQWDGAPQTKIPHATTWLNREDWLDMAWKNSMSMQAPADLKNQIASQLKRLGRSAVLPPSWQSQTAKQTVGELTPQEMQAYLLELQSEGVRA